MRWKSWMMFVFALPLAGCGGGGGDSGDEDREARAPQVSSGILDAGTPVGVSYSTATQSGVTDASGAFRYIAGETVRFSVAGVELGSARGEARISLFALAGMAPATSELQLRRELSRVSRRSTEFSRALNIARLLLALDADNDPRNGMDLRNRGDALAGARLDLSAPIADYVDALKASAPDLNNNLPAAVPVTMLYRWSGISVAGNQPVASSFFEDGERGSSRKATYDGHGRVTMSEVDNDGDGRVDDVSRYTYDDAGRILLTVTERNFDADDAVDGVRRFRSGFDARGNLVRTETDEDLDGDGTDDSRSIVESGFDSRGRPLSRVNTHDTNADGIVDTRQATTYDYDASGNVVSEITEVDQDLDGAADGRFVVRYTYLSGRIASRTYERDVRADGIEFRRTERFGFDAQNRLVHHEEAIDEEADGVFDRRERLRLEYDARGDLAGRVVEYEYNSGGLVEDWVVSRFTHDEDRRLLSEIEEYFSLDEAANAVMTRNHAYDTNGFQVRADQRIDARSQPGQSRNVTIFDNDTAGAQLRARQELDDDGDGVIDRVASRQIDYEGVPDAVAQIAAQYLQGG